MSTWPLWQWKIVFYNQRKTHYLENKKYHPVLKFARALLGSFLSHFSDTFAISMTKNS